MRAGRVVPAACAALLAVLAIVASELFLRSDAAPVRSAASGATRDGGGTPSRSGTGARTEDAGGRLEARRAADADVERTASAAAPDLQGRVSVFQGEVEHDAESGSFLALLADPTDVADVDVLDDVCERVVVTDGAFRMASHGATRMAVKELVLGGYAADAYPPGVALTRDRPVSIRAVWSVDVLLHVVDDGTGAELSGVRVVDAMGSSTAMNPGRIFRPQIVLQGATSPFHLVQTPPNQKGWTGGRCFIGAPDHAWTAFSVSDSKERERTVRLAPGGRLLVTIREKPHPEELEVRLRLRGLDGSLISEDAPESDEATEFTGLPVGEVAASLEIGRADGRVVVVDRRTATIAPGTTARVQLTLGDAGLAEPVPLAGTLVFPESWGRPVGALRIDPLDLDGAADRDSREIDVSKLPKVPGAAGETRWDAGLVRPARYRIQLASVGFACDVVVGGGGLPDYRIVIPEAGQLHVTTVDDESGDPVALLELSWVTQPRSSNWVTPWKIPLLCVDRDRNHRGSVLVGSAPLGQGAFATSTLDDWSVASSAPVELHAGPNDLVVRLKRRCGVRLEILPRDVHRRLAVTWTREVEKGAGYTREESGLTILSCDGRLLLPWPGHYTLQFHEHPELAPLELDVPPGQFVQQTVRLDEQ